ncbi:hypothetical protein ACIBHY_53895 [Nonomuraea sp. NPDC050547]|uniref:hypothetical protein n=1 Tax=Nonomuraea sp. NPDC050547 TaxID=3364368 RepID=UPI00379CD200
MRPRQTDVDLEAHREACGDEQDFANALVDALRKYEPEQDCFGVAWQRKES